MAANTPRATVLVSFLGVRPLFLPANSGVLAGVEKEGGLEFRRWGMAWTPYNCGCCETESPSNSVNRIGVLEKTR